jgi:hypothetical protein
MREAKALTPQHRIEAKKNSRSWGYRCCDAGHCVAKKKMNSDHPAKQGPYHCHPLQADLSLREFGHCEAHPDGREWDGQRDGAVL